MSTGREKTEKYKLIIYFFVKIIGLLPHKLNKKLFLFFRDTKGIKGIFVRYILLKNICKSCGDNVSIHPNVYLFDVERLSIGNNVSIHPMCYIDAVGDISIGNNVSIAHSTSILSANHKYSEEKRPIKYQGLDYKKVIVKDNVWIGARSVILYGTILNYGCIIGAGSVVTKNIEVNKIVGGNPARIIKNRV